MRLKTAIIPLAIILVLILALVGCTQPAPAPTPSPAPAPAPKPKYDPDPDMVTVSTTPMPAGKYMMMAGLVKIWHQNTRPTAVIGVGGGFTQLMTVVKGTAQYGTAMSPEVHWAYAGNDKIPDFQKLGPQPYLRKIMTISIAPVHVVVMANSPVKTLADMPKLQFPQAGTYSELNMLKGMAEAYGLKDVEYKQVAYGERYGAFKDRRQNHLTAISSLPGGGFVDIGSSLDVRFVSWDEGKLDAIVQKYPIFEKVVIPANMYPDQPEDVYAIAMAQDIVTYDTLNADLVYSQVKTTLENTEALVKLFKGWNFLDNQWAVRSHLTPYHEGAIRYYKEIGVWTTEHEKRQQDLLSGKSKFTSLD
ncbi:TAXI family TRAP transporter solute-binding subunit [Chloroflexota bacterium]